MLDQLNSAIDLPAAPLVRPGLLWTTAAIMIAALFLLATNAIAIQGWIDEMPPGPAQQQASEIAGQWQALTDRAGLNVPRAWLHEQWKRVEAARF